MKVMGMSEEPTTPRTELSLRSDLRPKESRLNEQEPEIYLSECPESRHGSVDSFIF